MDLCDNDGETLLCNWAQDFILQLMFLARKAYGQDIKKRKAAVIKQIELGLGIASLRYTYDEDA